MARAFKRLQKEAQRGRDTRRVLNWANRLHRLEEALFEHNARIVRLLKEKPEEELTELDKSFLESAEEFRQHVTEVLKHG